MPSRRALVLAAASPFVPPAGGAAAATPRDTLVVGKAIDDILSLDPAEAFEFSSSEICGNCYERLVAPDPAAPGRVMGELAESWTVSPDGLRFAFTLRPGLAFASGAPITAEDAAFSLRRAIRLNRAPAFILNRFGATADNAEAMIRATGPRSLVFAVAEPMAPGFVLHCLTATCASVVEKAAVLRHEVAGDLGNAWLRSHSAGSGPFVLRAWTPGDSVLLEASPRAPRPQGAPAPPRQVLYRHVADPAAQHRLLQRGEIDIARDLLPEQLRAAQANPELGLSSAPRGYLMYLAMNQKDANLAHPQVRQAIKWAIDYDAMQRSIAPSGYDVQQSFVPRGLMGAIPDRPFRRDVARARALLAEAGLARGFAVTIDHALGRPHADIARALQADLGGIGIRVTLRPGEPREVIARYRARRHAAAVLSWGTDYPDPNSNAEAFCVNTDNADTARDQTLAWRNAWQDADLTRRARAAAREGDPAARERLYAALQRDHHQRSPFALLLQSTEWAAMRRSVQGFALAPLGARTGFATVTKG